MSSSHAFEMRPSKQGISVKKAGRIDATFAHLSTDNIPIFL